MNKLAQFWRDLQKNWDIYITMLFSFVTVALSFFGKVNGTTVSSLTLSVLRLIAFSIRRDRQTDVKFKNPLFKQQRDAYRDLIAIINQQGAKEAVILQYSCRSGIDVVRTLLEKGAEVTV